MSYCFLPSRKFRPIPANITRRISAESREQSLPRKTGVGSSFGSFSIDLRHSLTANKISYATALGVTWHHPPWLIRSGRFPRPIYEFALLVVSLLCLVEWIMALCNRRPFNFVKADHNLGLRFASTIVEVGLQMLRADPVMDAGRA